MKNNSLARRFSSAPALVCLLFIALSGIYSVTTPIFEASDELWHYPYLKNIADGHGLPVQTPDSGLGPWRQEGSQPPLYYLMGSAVTFWIETGNVNDLYWVNPHATVGIPNAEDNKNMVVHTPAEDFPYRGVSLAVHIVRFLSVLMGAGTVYVTYLLALELFSGDKLIATGAALINALIPEFLFISGAINNDNLVTFLASLALLLMVRGTKHGLTAQRTFALSVIVGLAPLSKLSGLGLLGLVVVAGLIDVWRVKSPLPLIRWTVPVAAATALLSGWWYLRNLLLYGDPLGLNAWLAITGGRPENFGVFDLLVSEFEGFKMSFWAVLGGFNVLADKPVYWFFDALTVISLLGLARFVIQNRRRLAGQGPSFLLCVAWMGILSIALIRWTNMTLASQGRLMFPAISVIAIALFLGFRSTLPLRFTTIATACLGIAMFTVAVAIPFRNILPAYSQPITLTEQETLGSFQPIKISFQGKAELLGYKLSSSKVSPGDYLEVTLYWKALSPLETNYSVFVHLFGKNGEPIGQSDSFPAGGAYATRLWKQGEVILDRHRLAISPSAMLPSIVRIEAGLYALPAFEILDATDRLGKNIGSSPIIATVKLASSTTAKRDTRPALSRFEDKIALLEINTNRTTLAPGEVLDGSLVWRAETAIPEDYTVFIQLVGKDGLAAQYDSQPARGYYPTSLWEEGETIRDVFQVQVAANVQEGDYDLIAGLYRLSDGTRLRSKDDTFARLSRITVRNAR